MKHGRTVSYSDEARENRLVLDVARRVEDLETEYRAGERRLEKRRDAGGETCRHKNAARAHSEVERARDNASARRADKRHGAFIAGGAAGAYGKDRGDGLYGDDGRSYVAAVLVVRLDRAVGAARVLKPGEPLYQDIPRERTKCRKEYHRPTAARKPRAAHKERLAIVYHVAECNDNEPGDEPDKHRLHEILPGAEGYPLPGEEEFPA